VFGYENCGDLQTHPWMVVTSQTVKFCQILWCIVPT